MAHKRKKIGSFLVAAGLINEEQLEEALQKQADGGGRLGEILIKGGVATEEDMAHALSDQLDLPRVSLKEVFIPKEILRLLPSHILKQRSVVPLGHDGRVLRVAMVDPLDYITISEIEFRVGMPVKPVLTTMSELEHFLSDIFTESSGVEEALKSIRNSEQIEVMEEDEEDSDEDILSLRKAVEAAPVISMVNMILSEAVKLSASDIHIEPRERDLLVRYRIDGILRDMTTLPAYVHPSIISRVKIMARMDIAVRRRPQDGGTKIKVGPREVDLRISTLPTLYGEKMVIRILDKSQDLRTLEELGMLPKDLELIRSFLQRPQGMILVTGPTGSGKTTTLYASLLHVRSEGVNIITIEDPIEYQIIGINQVHVNNKAGITFATGLRSLLRQDPNIIMVGEIRDKETAEIAFQAALTGHLVLSTLHTNNAVSAVTRLMDIGVEPYLVASSVVGVVAQRLVRRNCGSCLTQYTPEAETLASLSISGEEAGAMGFYQGQGCPACRSIGFRGRIGLYEILKTDDIIRELIIDRASERAILEEARSAGMTTMEEVGLYLTMNKVTTPEEILRVIPPEEITAKKKALKDRASSAALLGQLAAEGEPVEEEDAPVEKENEALEKEDEAPVEGPVIILAEEKEGSLGALAQLLERDGHRCLKARRSREVLEYFNDHDISLIISEQNLDDFNIKELEALLKNKGKLTDVSLLAATGKKGLDTLTKDYGLEEARIITKPFRIREIRKKLKEYLPATL